MGLVDRSVLARALPHGARPMGTQQGRADGRK
jgi:hypothetical protein